MTDVQLLFLVLALLYGWECACWVAHGTVAFRSWLGRRWHMVRPGAVLGNQRGGFILAHPLPPLGTLLAVSPFPLALSPKAVLAGTAGRVAAARNGLEQSSRCLAWEQLDRIEVRGKKVLVKGGLLLKAGSPMMAAQLARLLREGRETKVAEREALLRSKLRQTFDLKLLEARWTEFQTQTRTLRLVANSLFGYLFALAPAVIWRFGFRSAWLALLAGLLGLTLTASILFRRAHKRLYPGAEDERFNHFLIILLSPASAIRALDVLSRPLLEACHPLALARQFCSVQQFKELAQEFLRELRYPAASRYQQFEPLSEETTQCWRLVVRETLEEFLKSSGVNPDQLLRPPTPADATSLAYCPRCLAQFTTRDGTCEDCGGLTLLAFSRAPNS